jgi:pimeloyl-ACP methyl ester carboxylesterase
MGINKVKRVNRKLGILLDSIKGFFIAILLFILIVFFASAIIHNLLRVSEVSNKYTGKYKNLYQVADKKMINIYSLGSGEETIVILPGYAISSPVLEYKALASSLSSQYRVVIVEYLGYGFSLSTKDERTNSKIIDEVRAGLQDAQIEGPYILMSFDISNIYANYYASNYPEEISGMISIDAIYAEAINNSTFKDEYLSNMISNVNFYSALSFSGVFRWASYLKPDIFNIDDISNSNYYSEEDVKLYRNFLSNKFLTKAMKNEIKKLKDNMNEVKEYKYSNTLPTLQVLTYTNKSNYIEKDENTNKYAKNLITNNKIQAIHSLEGDLSEYLFDSTKINELKNIINIYF